MKTKLFISIILIISLFTVYACDTDLDKMYYDPSTVHSPILEPIDASYVLTPQTVADTIVHFRWTQASLGYDADITNTLEMDLKGKEFSNPVTLASLAGNTVDNLNQRINILLGNYDMEIETCELEFRLTASISPSLTPVYSNIISSVVTPYPVVRDYPRLAVRGGYADWNFEPSQWVYSVNENDIYTGWIMFGDRPDGNTWKFCQDDLWAVNWGIPEAVEAESPTLTLTLGSENIDCYERFGYQFEFNSVTGALRVLNAIDGVGIVGSACPNQWDGPDIAMTPVLELVDGQYIWSLQAEATLTDGEIKFRSDNNWNNLNIGDLPPADGIIDTEGDNNIAVSAGTYLVKLYFNQIPMTYELISIE